MGTIKTSLLLLIFLLPLRLFAYQLNFKLVNGPEESCGDLVSQLQGGVTVSDVNIPAQVEAGESLIYELKVNKNFVFSDEQWHPQVRNINVYSQIEDPYPKSIGFEIEPAMASFFFDSSKDKETFNVQKKIPLNLGGLASHFWKFTFMNAVTFQYCIVESQLGRETLYQSDKPDITPPLVKNIEFDKPKYKRGESVTVTYTLSESLKTSQSTHIDFINHSLPWGTPSRGFPKFDSENPHNLEIVGDRIYRISFKVPEDALPGEYNPGYFNREDIYGNFEDLIGTYDEQEKMLVKRVFLHVE